MTINLNGQPITLAVLAHVVTALDNGLSVTIHGAAHPAAGPGLSALLLGQQAGQGAAIAAIEERLLAIERHPALSVPAL